MNKSQQGDLETHDNRTILFIDVVNGNRENCEQIRDFVAVLGFDFSDI